MLNKVKEYINDNEFKMIIFYNRINVVNYIKIITLEDTYISFLIPNAKLIIKGNNLLLNKLLDNEVLISGTVKTIEVDKDEE